MSPWHAFEAIRTLVAFPCVWRQEMGDHFLAFEALCLQPSTYEPDSYPCPSGSNNWHRIIRRYDRTGAVIECDCHPSSPHDLTLSIDDITPLQPNRPKLGRAICQALHLHSVSTPSPDTLPFTSQVGSWSNDAVPVVLTMLSDPALFRSVVAELVASLQKPFILLTPTASHLDLPCQNLLSHARAGFFPLETIVTLTPHGTLHATKSPGELLAQFTPQPNPEVGEDVARQTMALAKALDAEHPSRRAPLYSVFFLYCAKERTVKQIAADLGCSCSLVYSRLQALAQKLGRDPAELRQYSAHFERIERSLSDPRARNIYRQGATYGDGSEAGPED